MCSFRDCFILSKPVLYLFKGSGMDIGVFQTIMPSVVAIDISVKLLTTNFCYFVLVEVTFFCGS